MPALVHVTLGSRQLATQSAAHREGLRVSEFRLTALAAADVQALVDAQVEPYPARLSLRRAVAERARGNSFYAEELVRAFRERGDLRPGRRRLRPARGGHGGRPAEPAHPDRGAHRSTSPVGPAS
jgi:hypothetical protein